MELPVLNHYARSHPCRPVAVVLVAHLLPPLVPFLRALAPQVEIRCVLGIPYSNLPQVRAEVDPLVRLELPETLEQLAKRAVAEVESSLRESPKRTVLVEVGGYCADAVRRLAEQGLLGAVEHTMQGHWRYAAEEPLPCAVLSIAASRLKALENDQVGRSLAYSLERTVRRHLHRKLSDMRVSVLGYGGIGHPTARHLARLDADVSVFDVSPTKRAKAHLDGFRISERAELLARSDVVLGVSGHRSLTLEDMRLLRDGAIVASGSSKQVELDVAALAASAEKTSDDGEAQSFRLNGKTLIVLRNGQPLNFHAENVLGPVVDLIYTELYLCLQQITAGGCAPGLRELDHERQEAIADRWCSTYAG